MAGRRIFRILTSRQQFGIYPQFGICQQFGIYQQFGFWRLCPEDRKYVCRACHTAESKKAFCMVRFYKIIFSQIK
jgi:hypothetical protein